MEFDLPRYAHQRRAKIELRFGAWCPTQYLSFSLFGQARIAQHSAAGIHTWERVKSDLCVSIT